MDEAQRLQLKMAEELLFAKPLAAGFAKSLFRGRLLAAKVRPFPAPSAQEQRAAEEFLARLRPVLDAHLDAVAIDREARIPDPLIAALGEIGLLGLTLPQAHGGLGLSQYAYARAMEAVAARCGATAVFVNAHQSIGLKAILLFGNEAQQRRFLPDLARGRKLAAFALTEPNAGSDAAGIETRAIHLPERRVYLINGRKQWITNGAIAGVLTLMARMEVQGPRGKEDKICAFLVTPDLPGFKVEAAALEKCGIRGTATAKLAFENLEVPEENLLGAPGLGLKIALTVLDFGRLTFGASCTGAGKVLLQRAAAHAASRQQFHRPIGAFGMVQEKIARMASLSYAMEAMTYLTAGLVDRGEEDVMLETAILKVFASEALWTLSYEAMQVLGGRSFFTDEPFERMMRDARLNTIGEGANEVLRVFIALTGLRGLGRDLEALLENARRPAAWGRFIAGAGSLAADWLRREAFPCAHGELAPLAEIYGRELQRFHRAGVRVLARWREQVVDRQLDLNRIAEAAIALTTSAAVLGRLERDLTDFKADSPEALRARAAGSYYVRSALRRAGAGLDALFDPADRETARLSDLFTGI